MPKLKIAFLLMIHDNPKQTNCFIAQLLTYQHNEIFIHVDSKSRDIISKLHKGERIHFLKEHIDCQWGDYTQIQTIDALLRAASSYCHFDYYSLHSGSDMAIRPISDFVEHLHNTRKYAYYDCSRLPAKGWGHGGGLERLALYYPKLFRKRYTANHPIRYLRALYQMMFERGVVKGRPLPKQYEFYGGSEWFTISDDCLQDYFEFLKENPEYDNIFLDALAGDEIYFVTVFEKMKKQRPVDSKNNLTYIDWTVREKNGVIGGPNICQMTFLKEINQSEMFFARKFDWRRDREIVDYYMKKTITAKKSV